MTDDRQTMTEELDQVIARTDHEPDCAARGDQECEPYIGVWDQPDGILVREANGMLLDDAPWCRVRAVAWLLDDDQ